MCDGLVHFFPFLHLFIGTRGFLTVCCSVFWFAPQVITQRLFSRLSLKKDKKNNDSFKKSPIATKRETLNEWKMEKHNREEGCGV